MEIENKSDGKLKRIAGRISIAIIGAVIGSAIGVGLIEHYKHEYRIDPFFVENAWIIGALIGAEISNIWYKTQVLGLTAFQHFSSISPDTHVKCPDCREFIVKEARVCKHCGCKLVPQ